MFQTLTNFRNIIIFEISEKLITNIKSNLFGYCNIMDTNFSILALCPHKYQKYKFSYMVITVEEFICQTIDNQGK